MLAYWIIYLYNLVALWRRHSLSFSLGTGFCMLPFPSFYGSIMAQWQVGLYMSACALVVITKEPIENWETGMRKSQGRSKFRSIISCFVKARARSGPCNRSYCKAEIWGWLEDRSPPWRLLVPLWWLHLSHDQFCTIRGVQVGHKGGVVVKRTPVRPNSDSTEFHAWVVMNYSSYVVLE